MSDVADIANDRIEAEETIRRKRRESFKPLVSEDCFECGLEIPQARQEATGGTDMCIDCQSNAELRRRAYTGYK